MGSFDDKLRRFTVRPAGGVAPTTKEVLVVADPEDSLDAAFQLAKARLDLGEAVRIIAPGVTLRRAWPYWAPEASNLTLTEWGAFRKVSHIDATRRLRGELREWVDESFGGDFGGFPPNRVLFDAARLRMFEPTLAAYPVTSEILRHFPDSSTYCVRPHSPVAALLRDHGTATLDRIARNAPPPERFWRARILAMGAAGQAIAIGRLLRAYFRGRPTFSAIGSHRQRHPDAAPRTWVGVIPDWPRINYHLIEAFALPAIKDAGVLGVLLVGSLEPSQRLESDMQKHRASELWPGLGQLRERLPQCAVEQAVMPEDPFALAESLVIGSYRSARALWRLASEAVVRLPSLQVVPVAEDLVKWATIDVLRATLAEAATKSLLERRAMGGSTVVFVGANVAWSTADLALQRAGATTVEHDHGAHVDSGVTALDTESSLRLAWTAPDARLSALPAARVLVAGMPVRMRFPPRTREARNVLILTNYFHRDLPNGQCRAQRVFQSEILDVARVLRTRGHESLCFRWRPHPADLEVEIQRQLDLHAELELSPRRTLEEDAEWCDVIASTTSTTVVESMFAGVPVFVQVLPDTWRESDMGGLAADRVFYDAEHGATLLANWLARYASRPAAGLEPERLTRAAFFGETEEPVPMTERLAQVRNRSRGEGEPSRPLLAATPEARRP